MELDLLRSVDIYNQSTKELPFLNVNDYYKYAMDRIENPHIRNFIRRRIESLIILPAP